jgi:hypothetical protein
MIHQLLFQHAAGLDEETSIDRLVRQTQALVMGKLDLQPTGDLFRRPIERQFTRDDVAQLPVPREQARLGAQRESPRALIRSSSAIPIAPSVPCNLSAHGRWGSAEARSDRPEGHARTRCPWRCLRVR